MIRDHGYTTDQPVYREPVKTVLCPCGGEYCPGCRHGARLSRKLARARKRGAPGAPASNPPLTGMPPASQAKQPATVVLAVDLDSPEFERAVERAIGQIARRRAYGWPLR